MQTIEIIITGRVQKVGFRACVPKIATDLNITGTVINLANGKVHIFASGETMVLEKFISMIYSRPRAVVREIKTSESHSGVLVIFLLSKVGAGSIQDSELCII